MKGFRKLIVLGVFLVTLFLVINTIDAGRKQGKKKELETGKSYNQANPKYSSKNKQTESLKQNKVKNIGSKRTENFEEENQYKSKGSRFVSKKYDVRKNFKFANKDENSKTSKHFPNLKISKVLEEESIEKFNSGKPKVKKTKPQQPKSESTDNVFRTVKKTTQKKLIEENENFENLLSGDTNKNEDILSIEETVGGNPKKRKYKLVEVVLEEDEQEEEEEENEATAELGLEDQEFEETADKTKVTQNSKCCKNNETAKKLNNLEEDQDEELLSNDYYNNPQDSADSAMNVETSSDAGSLDSRYGHPKLQGSCKILPKDPNRQGPKKLILYVLEEEVDGMLVKRVVSEEDGVTMCEVADLLRESYYGPKIPEE